MTLHQFACECEKASCRQRVYLTEREWDQAAAKGSVITREHLTIRDVVVEAHRTFLVVTHRASKRAAA